MKNILTSIYILTAVFFGIDFFYPYDMAMLKNIFLFILFILLPISIFRLLRKLIFSRASGNRFYTLFHIITQSITLVLLMIGVSVSNSIGSAERESEYREKLLIEEWLKQDTLNIQTKYLKDSDLSYYYFGKEQKRCHVVLNDSLGLIHSKWVDNYFDDSQDFPDTIFIQDKIFPLSELFEQKIHINWLKDEEIDCIKFYQLNYESRKYLFFVGRSAEIWNHSPDKYWILIDITDKFSPQIYPVINSTMQPYFIGDRDANGVVEYLDWHLPNYQNLDTFYFYQINHIPEKMPFYLCGAPTEDNQSFWGMGGKWSYEILKIDRSNLPIK